MSVVPSLTFQIFLQLMEVISTWLTGKRKGILETSAVGKHWSPLPVYDREHNLRPILILHFFMDLNICAVFPHAVMSPV